MLLDESRQAATADSGRFSPLSKSGVLGLMLVLSRSRGAAVAIF